MSPFSGEDHSSPSGVSGAVKSDFGIVVDYKEPLKRARDIAEAIRQMLRSDLTRAGEAAKKEAEKYKWDRVIKEIEEAYGIL